MSLLNFGLCNQFDSGIKEITLRGSHCISTWYSHFCHNQLFICLYCLSYQLLSRMFEWKRKQKSESWDLQTDDPRTSRQDLRSQENSNSNSNSNSNLNSNPNSNPKPQQKQSHSTAFAKKERERRKRVSFLSQNYLFHFNKRKNAELLVWCLAPSSLRPSV